MQKYCLVLWVDAAAGIIKKFNILMKLVIIWVTRVSAAFGRQNPSWIVGW